ncbi:50S ribosomal protein L10 [Candidatus Micrarchaeota archaeon CG_4_10_14_0_2_um_filter_60_11]|nr:MAG: 50S ribosomal protein L10 [Candidatus Micrarchaeota archaeon CG1_02_60_51]PIN96363.1 MAG: 50S ribosomal protein L10 [Candidatus Micrarchaeota archaeon CG10_big_fil_rev_8_21_14_0_10_60_32]PIO02036.1 MAG: 50S ribosomal protein L10 [Candidatus Micrarchaeota archaeon CG09_land_8_20_14_0_10_60_16]PIZ91130.1 MAG: 50S ribosomal protein L10 [Candidatus Micrarchaeota archaeon CG_4_10_14_0_2_um_filter_60_11]
MGITREKKEELVKRIAGDLKKYPVIGVASIEGLPGKQYGSIKKKVSSKASISATRLTLMGRAIDESGRKELQELKQYFGNATVLVCTDADAFSLYRLFKQNKSKTIAKAGQIAPFDIIVPAGETGLAPGPILTELKLAKVDARIQGPKVVIARDSTVAKKGDAITGPAASILAKLGVEPFEIGFDVKAVWDHGTMYMGEVLNIDEEGILNDLRNAHAGALNLCVYAEVYNEASAPFIVAKAAREANALQKVLEAVKTPENKKEAKAEPAESGQAEQK